MKSNKIYEQKVGVIKLKLNEYLDSAFETIPSNTIINKGRCGIGGTTLELGSKRHSIIVVPNISIILNKISKHENVIGVYGKTSIAEIKKRIEDDYTKKNWVKIMVSPDSFYKIIEASEGLKLNIFESFFLLLDEYHSFITEGTYRENITRPFDYFWEFKHKSLISSTSYSLSHPNFKKFKKIDIITPHLNDKIHVIFSKYVNASLKTLINNNRSGNKNLHIFYNSVNAISKMVTLLEKTEDINIFCANNAENIDTLNGYSELLADVNQEGLVYKRINFYTTKYFEGWDLYDDKAIIVLVTDIDIEQTCLDMSTKGVQAIGRLRNKATSVYHITNSFKIESVSVKEIKRNVFKEAVLKLSMCNKILKTFNFNSNYLNDFSQAIKSVVKNFANFDKDDNYAELDYWKIDAEIYNRATITNYYNEKSILQKWTLAKFKVTSSQDEANLSREDIKKLHNQRVSKAKKNKMIFNKFYALEQNQQLDKATYVQGTDNSLNNPEANFIVNLYNNNELEEWKKLYPKHYEWYKIVGFEKAKQLDFNEVKIRTAYTIAQSNNIEQSEGLKTLVYSNFRPGHWYSLKQIKDVLNEIYQSLGVDKNMTAQDIKNFFKATPSNKGTANNRLKGFTLDFKLL